MIPESIYTQLLAAVSVVGADLSSECEAFLENEMSSFSGSEEEFVAYVRTQVRQWFKCAASYPEWVQNAEWQFCAGKPMLFVGQLAVPVSSGLFHDEAVIFVFVNESGFVQTVLQVV